MNIARTLKTLGVNYLWGWINFGVGAVAGATLSFAAIIAVLKAQGLL